METPIAAETPGIPSSSEDRFYGKEAASEPVTPAKPAESEPAKPSEAKPAETAPESEPGTTEEQKAGETPEQRAQRDKESQLKRLHRNNTRINRELGEARAEAKRLQEQLAARNNAKPPEPAPGKPDGEPQLEDFETYEAHKAALKEFYRNQTKAELESEQKAKAAQERQATMDATWSEKEAAYKEKNPDSGYAENYPHFLELVARAPHASLIAEAVIESEHGPQIVDYMAEHENEFNQLLQASRPGIGKIVAKLEDKFSTKTPPNPNTTNAPRVPSTVKGSGNSTPKLTREDKFYGKE